jgi:hypothetical protein
MSSFKNIQSVVAPGMAEDKNEIKEQNPWHILFTLTFLALTALSIIFLHSMGKFPKPVPVFDFIIMGIAVFRLTHLFVYDFVMHFVRDYFAKFQRGPGKTISNLLSCEWCTGMWTSLIVGFFYFLTVYSWYVILIIALAGVGTFIDLISQRLMRQ